jgi:ankyrin repeat protein
MLNKYKWLKKYLVILWFLGQANYACAGVYDDLLKALEDNNTAEVTAILQKGMDVNTVDRSGNSLLILAVQKGNNELVSFLLAHRARVRVRNQHGDTPLMFAALKGNIEIAKLLVAAGAEVNHAGWTPLTYAAFEGHHQVVDFLIKQGAEVDARAPNQATALMLASRNGHLETVKILVPGAGIEPA